MSGMGAMVVSALLEGLVSFSPFVIGGMLVVAAEAIRQVRRFGAHGALHRALRNLSDPAQDPQWHRMAE